MKTQIAPAGFPHSEAWLCERAFCHTRSLLMLAVVGMLVNSGIAQPANDRFADAIVLSGGNGSTTGSNVDGTKEQGEPSHVGNLGGSSVWWQWTAPANGAVIFDTFGSDFDTLLAVYTGSTVGVLTRVANSDDSGEGTQSRTGFLAVVGTTYRIAVDGYDGDEGEIVLNWNPTVPPANDDFADAIVIAAESGSASGSNLAATKEPGEPPHGGDAGDGSVWWQWTAPVSGAMKFDTFGSDFDTLLAVYTGSGMDSLMLIAGNDDSAGVQSLVGFSAVAGTIYRIAVDGYNGEQGLIDLNWGPTEPPVNDHFADATVITGNSGSADGSNLVATKEAGEPRHAGEAGGGSVWWEWTAPANGAAVFDTFGSEFDTLLAVYTGSSVDSLTLVGGNDDSEGVQSRVEFTAVTGTTYWIAVDGYGGEQGTITLNWSAVAPEAGLRITGIAVTGSTVLIDFTTEPDDVGGLFELHKAGTVTGSFTLDAVATFNQVAPGRYRVTTALERPAQFFLLRRP